jgi:hypothetical protein
MRAGQQLATATALLFGAAGCPEAGSAPARDRPVVSVPTASASAAPAADTASALPSGSAVKPAVAPAPTASAPEEPQPDRRCPPEMERIGRYCIDKWEAHLVSTGPNGEEVVHPRNIPPDPSVAYEARSTPDAWPQGHINRGQSERACQAAGKRLCAWIEWRRACQGPKWWRWPYGNELKQGKCNSGKNHLIRKLFGDDPKKWKQEDFNDPRMNEMDGFLAKTGAHPECVSPDGLYDMVGNLHEWVTDTVSSSFIRKMKEEGMPREKQPHALGNGMFLGGFYSTRSEHGMGCFFVTIAHSKKYYDYSTGFRCCKDASPPAGASD